jgi:hypothetical protein
MENLMHSTWSSVDLEEVGTDPEPWLPGADGLLRPGVRTLWWGSRGSGKSLAAMTLAIDAVASGCRVLYVDLENGRKRQARRRNDILGSRPHAVRDLTRPPRLDYLDGSFRFATVEEDAREEWLSWVCTHDLVILDSAARMLGQLGFEENSNRDFARFMTEWVDPLIEGGRVSVLILDNTGWGDSERSRGASAKMDLTEVGYRVTGGSTCAPDRNGSVELKLCRWRDGDEWEAAFLSAGGGEYGHFERAKPDRDPKGARSALALSIVTMLAEAPDGMAQSDVARALERSPADQSVRRILAELKDSGKVVKDDKRWKLSPDNSPDNSAVGERLSPPKKPSPIGEGLG